MATGSLVRGEDCREGIWNDYVMYPFNDASGKLNRVAVFGRDITRRKRAEEAVRSEHYQFISMFNGMDEVAYVADPETYELLYLNKFTKDCWGGEVGQKCYAALHGLDKPCFFCSNEIVLKQNNIPHIWEFYNKKNERWYHCIDRAISWHGDKTVHFELAIDITERKQYEEKILANQQQLNDLAIELSLAEERERRRLAIELHDQIGQLLVISKMKADSVKKNAENDAIKKTMDEVSNMLHKAIDDTKTLTFDLSCPMLYELGFEKAIAGYLLEEAQKYGLETEFISDGEAGNIDDNIGVLLFRHIKELLFNVVKHAKATKVTITSVRQDDMLKIEVADNGIGFDVSKVIAKLTKNKGFGLFSIRERLGQIGGDLEIVSDVKNGTSVTILAPMKK